MVSRNWIDSYNALNNSYNEKLVFRLGADAGYFSEFNNMVLAILFCLSRKIKFVLYSDSNLYSPGNAWNDFFDPFCSENHSTFNKSLNLRPYQINYSLKNSIIVSVVKKINNIDYLTQDFWKYFHDDISKFSEEIFDIPELGINKLSLLDSARLIIKGIWSYNLNTLLLVNEIKNQVELPEKYISIHVRSGDKFLEKELHLMHEYMNKVNDLNEKNIFVLTDDYAVVEALWSEYKDYNFFTLCNPDERGYFHKEFIKKSPEEKYNKHVSLFANIDICASSKKFIGTYSSNPGMYMGMRIGENNCIGIDYDNWIIW